jgi:DNA repair exonuclease SbcCD ATPase subunit
MFDAIKPLVDSGIINEDTQQALTEAWESKLNEAREQIRTEMRNEFATRYEHDKGIMVEALDRMITESLQTEIGEFRNEKASIQADRVRYNRKMMESAQRFEKFLVQKLAEEIKELRHDRRAAQATTNKLENFVIQQLAEEIQEFSQDKRDVVETKVRLIKEAKSKMEAIQQKFIERSARLVESTVSKSLTGELTQLKEDIQAARENNFGRKLFEAFASEFAISYLNENKEIVNLRQQLEQKHQEVMEAKAKISEKDQLVEAANREVQVIKESTERKDTLQELLKPLNREKQAVMSQLLETVQTDKLKFAFEKYLPAVLNSNSQVQADRGRTVLAESRKEVTGDKTAKVNAEVETSNVIELKRLAGLN